MRNKKYMTPIVRVLMEMQKNRLAKKHYENNKQNN